MKPHRSPMGPPRPPMVLDVEPPVRSARKTYQRPMLIKKTVLSAIAATSTISGAKE